MKTALIVSAAVLLTAWTCSAQTRFSAHGFNPTGAFHMTTSGATEVDVSTNLTTWTRLATVTQETTLDDVASRRAPWRFYRLRGGAQGGTNHVVGYVKVTVPPGKMAIVGNPFSTPLRLDSPHFRQDAFGMSNPPVKISLYVNGKFEPHTLEANNGTWSPPLPAIRPEQGFALENVGNSPVTLKLTGEVRQGQFNLNVPAGASLFVPPVPEPGPIAQVLALPGKDGMQLEFFNEETQKFQTSTYDTLENGWLPKPPEYRPGRAFVLKTPQPVTWTKSYSVR